MIWSRCWDQDKSIRERPKWNLLDFFVSRFHSLQDANRAVEEFNRIFVDKGLPDEMPEFKLSAEKGLWICHLLKQLDLVTSTSEARRLIQGTCDRKGWRESWRSTNENWSHCRRWIYFKSCRKKFAKVQVLKWRLNFCPRASSSRYNPIKQWWISRIGMEFLLSPSATVFPTVLNVELSSSKGSTMCYLPQVRSSLWFGSGHFIDQRRSRPSSLTVLAISLSIWRTRKTRAW